MAGLRITEATIRPGFATRVTLEEWREQGRHFSEVQFRAAQKNIREPTIVTTQRGNNGEILPLPGPGSEMRGFLFWRSLIPREYISFRDLHNSQGRHGVEHKQQQHSGSVHCAYSSGLGQRTFYLHYSGIDDMGGSLTPNPEGINTLSRMETRHPDFQIRGAQPLQRSHCM